MSLLVVVSEMNKFEQVSSNHPPDISLAGAVGMSRGYAQRGWGMSRGAALTMSLAYLRSTRDTPPLGPNSFNGGTHFYSGGGLQHDYE